MIDKYEPFERGQTFYGTSNTIDTSDYGESVALEGRMHTFQDMDPTMDGQVQPLLSQMAVTAIIVRNVSGKTLIPGNAVTFQSAYFGRRVDGYARTTGAAVAGIVDDWLNSSNGVRNGDLFWLIVRGPVLARVSKATADYAGNSIAEGDLLIAATAATSQSVTTGGRFTNMPASFTATQATDTTMLKYGLNVIGRAVSTAASATTNTDKLVDLKLL